ncbi:MAG: hypothetical protein GY710_16680 [Desulfobacteraceae bacterium]|nr:hypothetical protein [Desulfobacteraceae bacterium]
MNQYVENTKDSCKDYEDEENIKYALFSDNSSSFSNDRKYQALRAEITRIIHQLVYIHYWLYKTQVLHGDLHMGNIKVITDTNNFPIVKAFDFGKSKIGCSRDESFKDLQYFCNRKAVSGYLETFSRNKTRKDCSVKQAKHYPLHRLSMLLLEGRHSKDYVYQRIDDYGNNLLDALRNGNFYSRTGLNNRIMLFQAFSNDIASIFYYPENNNCMMGTRALNQLKELNRQCILGMSNWGFLHNEKANRLLSPYNKICEMNQMNFRQYNKYLKTIITYAIARRNPLGFSRTQSGKACLKTINRSPEIKKIIGNYLGFNLKHKAATYDNLSSYVKSA